MAAAMTDLTLSVAGNQRFGVAARAPRPAPHWRPRLQPLCAARHWRSKLRLAARCAVPEAAAELAPADQGQWVACSELVQQRTGLDGDEADTALLKAFGWKGQGFWRQERVKQVPCPDQVIAALDYLAEVGIAEPADVAPLVRAFPEALGLQVDLMADNVAVLRDKWFMKGNALLNAIKRKPRVLGNCIDCEGNCAGMCTRCWAQF